MNGGFEHWIRAVSTFVFVVVAGGIVLSLARVYPEIAHEFMSTLPVFFRIGFVFGVCCLIGYAALKLLNPRFGQLWLAFQYPPAWLAASIGILVLCILDLVGLIYPADRQGMWWEWVYCVGGSILVLKVPWIVSLFRPDASSVVKLRDSNYTSVISLNELAIAPWETVEQWFQSDTPASHDLLGTYEVAVRLGRLLKGSVSSIGIVGTFGAGKSSVVRWLRNAVEADSDPRIFVSVHSCWGFENSAAAIHEMLESAIERVSREIDTFQVASLPESYRQTFSAGGTWLDALSKVVITVPSPHAQFERLSELLKILNAKFVFVVEDVDRNETIAFEVQEVLGFLNRLKPLSNLSFVLTGGRMSSSRIDFSKLCDHIEQLPTIAPRNLLPLVSRLRKECIEPGRFNFIPLANTENTNEWHEYSGYILRDSEELSLAQAVSWLLSSPRALRHALGRTYEAWKVLHGEVAFDHLLAINVLRYGAPECLDFLIRRWDRLHGPISQSSYGSEPAKKIRQAVSDDWRRTTENADWNAAAAFRVISYLFPEAGVWLSGNASSGYSYELQGICDEKYWLRAVNESISTQDVRDQTVAANCREWLSAPDSKCELIKCLTDSERYATVWLSLMSRLFANQYEKILLLCEHVFERILETEKSDASRRSQGFNHVIVAAQDYASTFPEISQWLDLRIRQAAETSIEFMIAIWQVCAGSNRSFAVPEECCREIRKAMVECMQRTIVDEHSLGARLSAETSYTLYQLVFDEANHRFKSYNDIETWKWLGPFILKSLRARDVNVAANCGVLLGARVTAKESPAIDTELLDALFGSDASEAIQLIDDLSDQFHSDVQRLIRGVISAARSYFHKDESGLAAGI